VFNFLVRRVIASGFMLVGSLIAISNVSDLLPGGTTLVNGVPSDDLVFRWVAVLLPALVALLGFALFRVQPYSPQSVEHDDV
jgi:hypothetical protein